MSTDHQPDQSIINRWQTSKHDQSSIEIELKKLGIPSEHAQDYFTMYQKQILERRQIKGFIYMGIGAFLGFVSCVLTLTNLFPSFYDIILYGLTSVAVLLIFTGLYLVFEN